VVKEERRVVGGGVLAFALAGEESVLRGSDEDVVTKGDLRGGVEDVDLGDEGAVEGVLGGVIVDHRVVDEGRRCGTGAGIGGAWSLDRDGTEAIVVDKVLDEMERSGDGSNAAQIVVEDIVLDHRWNGDALKLNGTPGAEGPVAGDGIAEEHGRNGSAVGRDDTVPGKRDAGVLANTGVGARAAVGGGDDGVAEAQGAVGGENAGPDDAPEDGVGDRETGVDDVEAAAGEDGTDGWRRWDNPVLKSEAIDRGEKAAYPGDFEDGAKLLAVEDGGSGAGGAAEGDRLGVDREVFGVGAGGDEDGVAGAGGVDGGLDRGEVLGDAEGLLGVGGCDCGGEEQYGGTAAAGKRAHRNPGDDV